MIIYSTLLRLSLTLYSPTHQQLIQYIIQLQYHSNKPPNHFQPCTRNIFTPIINYTTLATQTIWLHNERNNSVATQNILTLKRTNSTFKTITCGKQCSIPSQIQCLQRYLFRATNLTVTGRIWQPWCDTHRYKRINI